MSPRRRALLAATWTWAWLWPALAGATLSSTTVWEVRQGGASTSVGGFNPGNANMATDLAATSATGGSPVVTSASYNFVAGDVGAWVFVKSGTNWVPGWYQVASVASNAATLTAGVGTVNLYQGTTAQNTSAGCATTASPTGGTWTVDYSQQAAAQVSYTDMVIGGTTTQYTSTGNPVGKNIVGNLINVTSGTGFTVQVVEVVSTSGTTATCDKSLGTAAASGGNGKLGGATDHPATIGGKVVTGNTVFIQYSATAYLFGASSNVSGGSLAATGVTVFWQGYNTTRSPYNTDALRPILRVNADSITMWKVGLGMSCNLSSDNPSNHTGVIVFRNESGGSFLRCASDAATRRAFDTATQGCLVVDCVATNPAVTALEAVFYGDGAGCAFVRCVVSGGSGGKAFWLANFGDAAEECVATGFNSGSATVYALGQGTMARRCVAYNCSPNSGVGVFDLTGEGALAESSIAYGNTNGVGFRDNSGGSALLTGRVVNCAGGANQSNYSTAWRSDQIIGFQALTGSPFSNAGGGDYSLNNTAGAGDRCRSISTAFQGLSTTSYPDMGAAQHQASSTGGYRPRPRSGGNRRRKRRGEYRRAA